MLGEGFMPKEKREKLSTTVSPITMKFLKARAAHEDKTPGEIIDDLTLILATTTSQEVVELLIGFCEQELTKREEDLKDLIESDDINHRIMAVEDQIRCDLGLYLGYFESLLPWEKLRDRHFYRVDMADGDYALVQKDTTLLFPERAKDSKYLYSLWSSYLAREMPVEEFILPTKEPLEITPEFQAEVETEIEKQWPDYKKFREEVIAHGDDITFKPSEFIWPYVRPTKIEWEYSEVEEHEGAGEKCMTDRSFIFRKPNIK